MQNFIQEAPRSTPILAEVDVLVAGGGFAGGRVLGSSDARGEYPATRPVTPVDLLWSIYELAGIDPAAKLPNPRNLDVTILPPDGGKNKISELYREDL